MNSNTSELKPCPFCGEPITIIEVNGMYGIEHDQDCPLDQNPSARMVWPERARLVEEVNRRALEDALRAELVTSQAGEKRADKLMVQAQAELEAARADAQGLAAALANARTGTIDILSRALAGYTDDYKYTDSNGNRYTKWGLVQADIIALFPVPNTGTGEAK